MNTWIELSNKIKARDGNKCKHCGVQNGAVVFRLAEAWAIASVDGEAQELIRMGWRQVKIVLTTAHLDQNPRNNDPENLAALCQRCHLNHDRPYNPPKAKRTRQDNIIETQREAR